MFRNILVPTDGSVLSQKAVKKSVALAKKTGARITGFHVSPAYKLNVYAEYIVPDFIDPKKYEARQKKIAEKYLQAVKKQCQSVGVRCTTGSVCSDYPADAIIKASRKYKCDLIAMASHGRKGLSKMLLGSETQKVLANTSLAVLVLR
jgi:nucleotide-binding universal stress UspA family protein